MRNASMPGRQAKPGPHAKDRLPGAVTTHATTPLLSAVEIWAVVAFLACVLFSIVALETWAARPLRRAPAHVSGTHPLLSPPSAPGDEIDLTGLIGPAQ